MLSVAKARPVSSIRYANHSARGVAPDAVQDVAASREAVTWVGALGHAKQCCLHSATTVICAYVTSGDPLVTTRASAVQVRDGITPRRMASSWPDMRAAQCLARRASPGRRLRELGSWRPATPALFCGCRGVVARSPRVRRSSSEYSDDVLSSARCARPAMSSLHRTCRPAQARHRTLRTLFRVHDFVTASCGDCLLAHLGDERCCNARLATQIGIASDQASRARNERNAVP